MTETEAPERRYPGVGVVLLFLLVVGSIAGVTWWQNQRRADLPPGGGTALADLDVVCLGRVDGLDRTTDLDPRIPGRVVALLVAEGQHVAASAPLLRLDDSQLKLKEEEALSAVKAADIEVDAAKLEQKQLPIRRAAQEAAVAAAADRIAVARRVYDEKKMAKTFGTVTAVELIVAESEVKQLEQLEGAEKSRLDELKLADPSLKVRGAEVKRGAADIALKQARKALEDCVLLAPTAGTVLRVQTSVGKSVAPGTPLPAIVFRPDAPLVVWAELEQEFLGRVKIGMKATIRDDARSDSPTWTGKVLRVGHVIARKRSLLLEPGEVNDVRTVECIVGIDGDTSGLLVGQRMRVRLGRGE
ncbi:secretion protein : Multidrug resistance efflux pump OS=Singulisphaera acidiphila (strain ATCC BAA-1392 / DSM 18658 / VKM B-2454 / MOB10) GN=Sinac_2086 PE=4 SV=1: HlyD [Gemmataceae bacterium]|nr:secretion protein : Multidrug resistance efflux pump OS=Singulisphaera acidiphila (strain ATCC BAA-1392 / DSM 18658 / VKM B-2454 / MOB10) GN=Sinac_2086 PE=4 SV=1: HlyD [Gemmataceae bacterium]VTU01599.1 secretion protein : Multidrug resistance efflux pump OS=Singulisphaera acidiphila (strain ATCC BAA-1392 / DSM 18658 / VKM B-2454 / MOB10) GN=Sinac_2086 PE=4 SV=1: HlyD [Gemmataceae bacterium]